MATVVNNDLTRGLRGRVGKLFVFRTFHGKTVVSRAPRKPDPLKQSTAQRQTRTTFRDAAAWAVRTLMDPTQKQYFTQLAKNEDLPNAYTAAVREYMRRVAARNGVQKVHVQASKESDKAGRPRPSTHSFPEQARQVREQVRNPKMPIAAFSNGILHDQNDPEILRDNISSMHKDQVSLNGDTLPSPPILSAYMPFSCAKNRPAKKWPRLLITSPKNSGAGRFIFRRFDAKPLPT